jgi:CubicO group peptidase (beta-lactamase class C family)
MNLRKILPLTLLLFTVWLRTSLAEDPKDPKFNMGEFEKVVSEEMKLNKTPGVAFVGIKGEGIIFSKGFGISTTQPDTPITPDSLLQTGSVGKMLTAIVVARLAEEGKLKFDEPIGTYVKELSPKVSKLTLHQLLSHTAGLRDADRFTGSVKEEDLRNDVLAWKDNIFFEEPNKIFSYSNIGYSIAGLVIEQVTGKTYSAAMDELLFKPVGMTHTTFAALLAKDSAGSQQSKGKVKKFMGFTDFAVYRPAGFHVSTVNDLVRFATAILNKGMIEDKQVLSPTLFSTISIPHVPAHTRPYSEHAQYGYGVFTFESRGVKFVEHGGSVSGFGCRLVTVPEHQVAVIMMTNTTGGKMNQSVEKALEMMLPLTPKVDDRKEISATEDELKAFVGTYAHPYIGHTMENIQISIKNGKLFVKHLKDSYSLNRIGPRRFTDPTKIQISAVDAVFLPASDGSIEYLHLKQHAWKKVLAP